MYKCFFIIFMLMLLPNQAAKAQETSSTHEPPQKYTHMRERIISR